MRVRVWGGKDKGGRRVGGSKKGKYYIMEDVP